MIDIPRLPPELVERVRQVCDDAERPQWVLGDELVSINDELAATYARYMESRDADEAIRRARAAIIRQLAGAVGVDASTLRDRESMARFFPYQARLEYDHLTYHQLRACKAAGSEWRKYADWAQSNLPAPVAKIRAMIREGGDIEAEPLWKQRWSHMLKYAVLVRDDQGAPDKYRRAAAAIVRGG